jgi:hypothetical protein|tara:strand:- start:1104 stop:1448 length:345 start_codon:yes stop_codon:yes gene_type:complete
MTPSEFAMLREDIGRLYEKADDCAQTGARIEAQLVTHREYIDECYAFREKQVIFNNGVNEKFLKIKITRELKAEYTGDDRINANIIFDRIVRILTVTTIAVFGIFTILFKFGIL